VALHPRKLRLSLAQIPLFNPVEDGFNKILVFNRFLGRVLPVVFTPVLKPNRHAIYGVVAVTVNHDVSVNRRDVKSALDSSEFGALISLTRSCQGFRDISGFPISYEFSEPVLEERSK